MTPTRAYLKKIDHALQFGNATEHTYRPALKEFIESLAKGVTATNEPKRVTCGAPDFTVFRTPGPLTIGYIEAKDMGESLDKAERSAQLHRYLHSLENLLLTDYLEFRWYVDGTYRSAARLARVGKQGRLVLDKTGEEAVTALLQDFLSHSPEAISTPKELAERMARLTHLIRDIIVEAFAKDTASDLLCDLRKAFATTLIPDLDHPEKTAEFADMYAQTLAYGLFAARCNHRGVHPFHRLGAAADIPKTNPFLRRLFETITGTDLDDEPYVGFVDDVVQLLAHANVEAILEHFGKRTRREDPVVHFYETFLATYDSALREMRGVYYTPEPVVSYIVRSVDHVLKTHFGLSDGFADTATVEYEREEDGKNPRQVKMTAPRVLILDPACGTGTFLYAVLDRIREKFMAQGNAGMWSGYVRQHLLPRMFGFELLMAPYAVAHFKLGMQLAGQDLNEAQRKQWSYDFSGDERLEVYLTNTLEQTEKMVNDLFGPLRVITEEAVAASRVKEELPIMVILGNPPYSYASANNGAWINALVRDYYSVDGQPLGERNPKGLQDDYVKFIRWAQWRIERTGAGILAFITNHGYLDNPTFRGMRQALMKAFTEIYLLDLHGNAKKKERAPDGSEDQNVFDIQQGVAIGIFIKAPDKTGPATIHHAEIWGEREIFTRHNNRMELAGGKYHWLAEQQVSSTHWTTLRPRSPAYLFVPQNVSMLEEYERGWKITDIMPINSVGLYTARDKLAIHWTANSLAETLKDFSSLDPEVARQHYALGPDARDWQVKLAQGDILGTRLSSERIQKVSYRPWDIRYTYYTGVSRGFICMPRFEVMKHMLNPDNKALCFIRRSRTQSVSNFLVVKHLVDKTILSSADNANIAPLYLSPDYDAPQKDLIADTDWRPNFSPRFIEEVTQRLHMNFIRNGKGDLTGNFGPEDLFHYMYAVFYSPTYRSRNAEFITRDFPRLPITSSPELFGKLCAIGERLVALHLLDPHAIPDVITRYPIPGDSLIESSYPSYLSPGEQEPGTGTSLEYGRVYINRSQYFEGVPPEVWEFYVGGYQVCEKWLKDRKGRRLTYDDLTHYQRIVSTLAETIRLMTEIDEAIEQYGGWPMSKRVS